MFPPLLVAFVVAILLRGGENVIAKNGYSSGAVNYNITDVNKTNQDYPTTMVPAWYPKKEIGLVLPCLGLQSKIIAKQLKAYINIFYGCNDLRVIFQNTHRIKSLFPYKDRLNRSQMSKVVMIKLVVGTVRISALAKPNGQTEHFKAITSNGHRSAIAEHVRL